MTLRVGDVNGTIDIEELNLSQEMRDKVILAQISLLGPSLPEDREIAQIRATTYQHAALFVGRIMGETLIKLSLRPFSDQIYAICVVDPGIVDPAIDEKLLNSIRKTSKEGYVSVSLEHT